MFQPVDRADFATLLIFLIAKEKHELGILPTQDYIDAVENTHKVATKIVEQIMCVEEINERESDA